MKRRLLTLASAACLAAAATPAAACLPPPPPAWEVWLGNQDTPMFLGRVGRIEVLPPAETEHFIVHRAGAEVSLLEVVQGRPTAATATVEGATGVAIKLTGFTGPICTDYLNFKAGDFVVVVEGRGVYSPPPQLATLIEKYR
jgi:hypothetical protein